MDKASPKLTPTLRARLLNELRLFFEETGDSLFLYRALFLALHGSVPFVVEAELSPPEGISSDDAEVSTPLWILLAAGSCLVTAKGGGANSHGRGGRHSRPLTRAIDAGRDSIRAAVVERELYEGRSERSAFHRASKELAVTKSAGTAKVMRQSWKRELRRAWQRDAAEMWLPEDLSKRHEKGTRAKKTGGGT